jgi:RND family efflux transporter MFP subunit
MNVRSTKRTVVAWLVGCVASGCHAEAHDLPRALAVKVARVERTSQASATHYSAQIVPALRVDLAWKVGGYVESIAEVTGVDGKPRALQEGDVVTENAPLATLRQTEYVQKVAEARAAVAEYASVYRQAKLDLRRDTKLASSGSLAGATADTTRSRHDGASAALVGARVRLAQARTALADTRLTSPLGGVVVVRSIEVGSLAAPGTIAFSIADVSSVKAVFGVPDLFLPRITVGAAQKVTTDALPGVVLEGTVSRLAPSADRESHVFEVDVTIPNPDDRLKSGMVVALSLDEAPTTDALFVPLAAIVRTPDREGGSPFAVFVVEQAGADKRAFARPVELGEYLGRVVPIVDGLSGDELVVVQGAGLLAHGERVEVIP